MPVTPPPTRRALLAALPAGLLLGALPGCAAASRAAVGAPAEDTSQTDDTHRRDAAPRLRSATVVLLRHAEKADAADPDTPLSERGHARAAALASLLAACPPSHVFASEFRRTQQTVAPLADAAGRGIEVIGARDAAALVARLTSLDDGALAVVAGHSNTVPALATALGGALSELDPHGFMREDEYDRVVLLSLAAPTDSAPLRALQTLDLRLALPD